MSAPLGTVVRLRQHREDRALGALRQAEASHVAALCALEEAQVALTRNAEEIVAEGWRRPGMSGSVRVGIVAFHRAAARLEALQARRMQLGEECERRRRDVDAARREVDGARAAWAEQRLRRERLEAIGEQWAPSVNEDVDES